MQNQHLETKAFDLIREQQDLEEDAIDFEYVFLQIYALGLLKDY
jgi:hypothetical protein